MINYTASKRKLTEAEMEFRGKMISRSKQTKKQIDWEWGLKREREEKIEQGKKILGHRQQEKVGRLDFLSLSL